MEGAGKVKVRKGSKGRSVISLLDRRGRSSSDKPATLYSTSKSELSQRQITSNSFRLPTRCFPTSTLRSTPASSRRHSIPKGASPAPCLRRLVYLRGFHIYLWTGLSEGKRLTWILQPDFDRAWYTGSEHCHYCDCAFNISKDRAITDKEKIQDLDRLSVYWDVKMEIAAVEREHRERRAAAAKQEREKRKMLAKGDARGEWLRLPSAVGEGAGKEDGVKEEANDDENADDTR